ERWGGPTTICSMGLCYTFGAPPRGPDAWKTDLTIIGGLATLVATCPAWCPVALEGGLSLVTAARVGGVTGACTVACDPLRRIADTISEASGGSAPKYLGRASTADPAGLASRLPIDSAEEALVRRAMADPASGRTIIARIGDPRWSEQGWVKKQLVDESAGETRVVLHYLFNPEVNAVDDFKVILSRGRP
ncbi:MAG: hypothetical protein U0667_18615, partial [Chloroflexota bacterium]